MRAKGMNRWRWVLVLAVLITVWLVLPECASAQVVQAQVAAGAWHTVGLKSDGTVVAVGSNGYGQLNVESWSNIVQVAAGIVFTAGLKSDGTVVAVGRNDYGQANVGSWSNIVQVAGGAMHTVGLKSDGTVVFTGACGIGECNASWSNIVQVAAGSGLGDTILAHTVGLKSDGTVVAVGTSPGVDVGSWSNIVQVAAGGGHTVGLKADGTVVAVGDDYYGQLNVSSWSNIVQVAAGFAHTVGLKSDGTVVAVGLINSSSHPTGSWSNIVQVAAGAAHTVGLKSDGTVVAVGDNSNGQCNVLEWNLLVGFGDVPPDYWAHDYIMGIYNAQITAGCSADPLEYCPDDSVTREQMAVFITRALNQVPEDGYCGSTAPFSDVAADRWSCKYVKRLVELGITAGVGQGLFGPEDAVTREQMAAFITRALGEVPSDGYCGTEDPFTDVPYSWWSCKYVRRLAELGITAGIGEGLYGPGNPVTRAQMAVFLARAFLGM